LVGTCKILFTVPPLPEPNSSKGFKSSCFKSILKVSETSSFSNCFGSSAASSASVSFNLVTDSVGSLNPILLFFFSYGYKIMF
jgi:hypothetical protein